MTYIKSSSPKVARIYTDSSASNTGFAFANNTNFSTFSYSKNRKLDI